MTSRLALVSGLALVVIGCSDTNIIVPTAPTAYPTTGTPGLPPGAPVPVTAAKIEFRVSGNATGARVRYATSTDGSSQVTSALPFVFTIAVAQPSIFLSLAATPLSYGFLGLSSPFMSAQIFVNGILFREATSSDFFLSTVSASGTWRSQ